MARAQVLHEPLHPHPGERGISLTLRTLSLGRAWLLGHNEGIPEHLRDAMLFKHWDQAVQTSELVLSRYPLWPNRNPLQADASS